MWQHSASAAACSVRDAQVTRVMPLRGILVGGAFHVTGMSLTKSHTVLPFILVPFPLFLALSPSPPPPPSPALSPHTYTHRQAFR